MTNPSQSAAFAPVSRSAEVLLTLPVEADWLALARTTCAAVAARADFSYDEIADLRLAIDEVCLSLIERSGDTGRIELRYALDEDELRVDATIITTGISAVRGRDSIGHEFSERILEALVDAHGGSFSEGRPHAWMTKRRANQ
jgi:serine/threonine-protein kinase RsbW